MNKKMSETEQSWILRRPTSVRQEEAERKNFSFPIGEKCRKKTNFS